MATTTRYLPSGDSAFLTWTTSFLAALSPLLDVVNFPPAEYELLVSLKNTFSTALATANAPATRNAGTIQAKNDAHKALEKEVRGAVMEFLAYNRSLTNKNRQDLGIPMHDTEPTPVPVPTSHPEFSIERPDIARLTVHFHDAGTEHRGKPYGVSGAVFVYDVLDEPPVGPANLSRNLLATRTPHVLEFADSESGKRAYITLCWQNTKGEKGPWSPIQSSIIP